MALNQEFFDAINIDVVKKKYYNANKVNAVLDDIRTQALALTAENEQLRQQLSLLTEKKAEIGDTLMSAQVLAKRIVEQANARADEIVKSAEAKRTEMLGDGAQAQEYAARSVEKVIEELKNEHLHCIDLLNMRWQSFLCGLDSAEDDTQPADEDANDGTPTAEAPREDTSDTELPELSSQDEADEDEDEGEIAEAAPLDAAELEARVTAIAKELYEIMH